MRALIPALALLVVACQDLDVTNPNEPDRFRATLQPAATESFIATSFRTWWVRAGHDDDADPDRDVFGRAAAFADYGRPYGWTAQYD